MEATELTTEQETQRSASEDEHSQTAMKPSFSDHEEEKIKIGTSLTIGMCGTYAVAAEEGLVVYPSRPTSSRSATPIRSGAGGDSSLHSSVPSDEDIDSLVRVFHIDTKMNLSPSATSESDETKEQLAKDQQMASPIQLRRGDRVQVVSWEGGWAKLARGYGYVKAESNQLVKGKSMI
jgi:hypothetical protein